MSRQAKRQIHPDNEANKDFIAMTLPLLAMGLFFYGPRVLVLAAVAVITAKITDRLAALLRGRSYDSTENLSVAVALIMVVMMPATVRYRVVVMAVLAAVLVGKEAFGGPGNYPFNPAAVGYCVAAVSFSEEMFRYPEPQNWLRITDWSGENFWNIFNLNNVTLMEGPSYTLRHGGLPHIDTLDLILGNYAGPLGTTAVLVILACAVYLFAKKRLPFSAPVAFLGVIALIAFLFPRAPYDAWRIMPWYNWADRLQSMEYELFSGAIVFAAVFLVPEPCTLPKNTISRLTYGAVLGFATMMFRYFGIYDLGTCFAFLLVNAVSGYFDRAIATRAARKGAVAK